MYISLVGLKDTDSYDQHQAIWSLFPNTPDRKRDHLFRIEGEKNGQQVALLQSSSVPKSSDLARVLQTKAFDLNISNGECFKFKLVAYPAKRLSKERRVVEIKDESEQIEWLQRKLVGANVTVTSIDSKLVASRNSFNARYVTYEGVLQITNSAEIYSTVVMGVGRKKHAGAGLLSLARAK